MIHPLKIQICAYDSLDGIGGPFVWITRICPELIRAGLSVEVLLFQWAGFEHGKVWTTLTHANVPVVCLPMRDSHTNVRRILVEVERYDPDVFVANHLVPALLSVRHLTDRGIPSVGVLRSDEPFYHAVIDRFVAGDPKDRLSGVVCVSNFLRSRVLEHASHHVECITIPSGTRVPARTTQFSDDVFRVAYVGRFADEQKQIMATASVLHEVSRRLPLVRVDMYGNGPQYSEVKSFLETRQSNVSVRKDVDSEAIYGIMQEVHALVLLSDYEGTPTSVMEAMACGVVPICLQMRSGIPELVRHEHNGLIVADRMNSVISAVQRLQGDKPLWIRMSRNARQWIQQNYSLEKSADLWIGLLQKLALQRIRSRRIQIPTFPDLAEPHESLRSEDVRLRPIPSWKKAFSEVVSKFRQLLTSK